MTHVQESNAARPLFQIASMSFLSRIFVITLLALGAAPVWAACQEQQASPSVDDCKKKEEQAREAMAKEREEERRKVRQICEAHKDAPIPPEDLPTEQDRKELAKCASGQSLESGIFYAGVTVPPDYVKARKCAYLERESDMGWPQIGGAARLLQIYARGRGIPKNMNLAVRFACEWGKTAAGAEFESLVRGMDGTDAEVHSELEESEYSVCYIAISGGLASYCSWAGHQYEKIKREAEIETIKVKWSKETLAAYESLYEEADHFFKEEAEFLILPSCFGCTSAGAYMVAETEEMWPRFYALLKNPPMTTLNPSDFQKADKKLNVAYRHVIENIGSQRSDFESDDKEDKYFGPDSYLKTFKSALKDAQLTWIGYRDAFENFGSTLSPPVSYKKHLTTERTKELDGYAMGYELIPCDTDSCKETNSLRVERLRKQWESH